MFLGVYALEVWPARRLKYFVSVRGVIKKADSIWLHYIRLGSRRSNSIRYRYVVDGRRFTGTRVAYGWGAQGRNMLEIYRKGKRVTVWYDPANPSRSVLTRDVDTQRWIAFTGGSLVAAGAIILVLGVVANTLA